MKNKIIKIILTFVVLLQTLILVLGGTLAILEFLDRKDLSDKILNLFY
jgi:hypothetical protein